MTPYPKDAHVYNAQAIVLRRTDYGDHDYILTLLTREKGKISVLAKNAKKSVKRFAGTLELFYHLDLVIRESPRMAYLMETSVNEAFENIRWDIVKTAYASYWTETVVQFMEEGIRQEGMFSLLSHCLSGLDSSSRPAEEWSIYFHLKFLELTGHSPELSHCLSCGMVLDSIPSIRIRFDIKTGGISCERCQTMDRVLSLTKGTIKQLLWFQMSDPEKAAVVRFSRQALGEGLGFLETFLAYHLEKDLRSLQFLNKIRFRENL